MKSSFPLKSDSESTWAASLAGIIQGARSNQEEEDIGPVTVVHTCGLENETVTTVETDARPADKHGLPIVPLVHFHECAHLALAQEAVHGMITQSMSEEEFTEKLGRLSLVADNGLKLFGTPFLKNEVAKLPVAQRQIIAQLEEQCRVLQSGVYQMHKFLRSRYVGDLYEGLEKVEQSMEAVDGIQVQAAARIQELEAEAMENKAKGLSFKPNSRRPVGAAGATS